MFNFEGKTSGIKNFQIDVFLANHWFEPLKELIEAFHAVVSKYHLMIDQNIIENNNLTKRREELLPLLMNGQASVNYDLPNSYIYSLLEYSTVSFIACICSLMIASE